MADVLEFPTPKGKKPDRSVVARWGGQDGIWADGYVAVPTTFLRSLQTLALPFKLSPAEALFVIQVMSYKWSAEAPFPGYKVLSKHMGITPVYARALARSLEQKKLLRRVVRVGTTNRFDFTPLFEALGTAVGRGKQSGKGKREAAGE
jgi:hypothetical protein